MAARRSMGRREGTEAQWVVMVQRGSQRTQGGSEWGGRLAMIHSWQPRPLPGVDAQPRRTKRRNTIGKNPLAAAEGE